MTPATPHFGAACNLLLTTTRHDALSHTNFEVSIYQTSYIGTGNYHTSTTCTELGGSLDFRAEHPRACQAMSVIQLHWLPVRWRVQFKLCCVMHSIFHGTCPAYLSNIVEPVGAGRTRPRLRSTSTTDFSLPRLRTKFDEHSLATPVLLRGTTCLKICAPLQTQRSSDSS